MTTAAAHDALLDGGHLFGRQFHAQVAARHHHCVGKRNNFLQAFDGGRRFQFGDDRCRSADQGTGFLDIFGSLHERQCNPVGTEFQGQGKVVSVLGRQALEG